MSNVSGFRSGLVLGAIALCAPLVEGQANDPTDARIRFLDTDRVELAPDSIAVRATDGRVIQPVAGPDGSFLYVDVGRKVHFEFTQRGGKSRSFDLLLEDMPVVAVTMCLDPLTGRVKEIAQASGTSSSIVIDVAGGTGGAPPVGVAAPAVGDVCGNPKRVACGSSTTLDNTLSLTRPSDPEFSCRIGGPAQGVGTLWFKFRATSECALIDTEGSVVPDTLLAVYEGRCGDLTEIACDDDSGTGLLSSVMLQGLDIGSVYRVQVAGWGPLNLGEITLNVTCMPGNAPGDACVDAIEIPCGGTGVVNNSGFATDVDDPAFSCYFGGAAQGFGTAWFKFTPTATSAFIDTNLSLASDTELAVYSGTCGAFTELACSEDEGGGLLSAFCVEGLTIGETYFIQAASFSPSTLGEITVSVQCPCPAPPANDDCANAEALVLPASVVFDNTLATDDIAVPCGVASGPFKNVWYSVAGTGTTLTATTCNAGTLVGDTKISVFCADCGELVCVAGNDDDCAAGGPIFSSTVSWCSQVGANYFITVGNFSASTTPGIVQLDVFDDFTGCMPVVQCLPQGACCLPGGTCVVATADECAAQGGTYQGDDTQCFVDAVTDGSFEAGAFGGTWNEASTNFGTPLCDPGGCGFGGGTGPRTGDWWAWFGGIVALEVGSVDQDMVISPGAKTLDFWLEIPVSSGNGVDYLRLRVDGNIEFEVFEDDVVYAGTGYNLVSVSLAAYADGGLHNVQFESTITGDGGAITNFFVDDVSLDNGGIECPSCYVLDFDTEDDFTTPLVNGQDLSTPPEFGNLVSIGSAGSNAGPAVFDSTIGGPNAAGPDPDLVVGLGNVLIVQNDNAATQTVPGIFDVPDDDFNGGTLIFNFVRPFETLSLVLVDIDTGGPAPATVTLRDESGLLRVFTVPQGWTEDLVANGPPGWRTLDLTTLDPQPGFMSTATATEDPGFDDSRVDQIKVRFSRSGAVDDVTFCESEVL